MKDCLKDSATCELSPELALPLSICTWFLKYVSSLRPRLFVNLFQTVFLQITHAVKIKFEIEKRSSSKIKFENQFLWTRDFKNQVQINKRSGWEFFICFFALFEKSGKSTKNGHVLDLHWKYFFFQKGSSSISGFVNLKNLMFPSFDKHVT